MSRIRDKKIDGPVSKAVPMPPHDPRFVNPTENTAVVSEPVAAETAIDAGPVGETGKPAPTPADQLLRDVARDLLDAHNGGFADNKAYMAVKFAALAEALG